ncbi:MAG: hypothetical protein ACO3JG_09160 [Luteolibacter sp.]
MTLKGFHIVFVTVSLLLFAFLILWGFLLAPEKNSLATAMGVTGIVGVLLMPLYGVYFLRKARRIHL